MIDGTAASCRANLIHYLTRFMGRIMHTQIDLLNQIHMEELSAFAFEQYVLRPHQLCARLLRSACLIICSRRF